MTLHEQIVDLRRVFAEEAPSRLHSSSITDTDHPDEGGVGLPFTERFMRYVGHWSHWGQTRLGMLSVMEVSDWCSARHTSHQIPYSTRSLCAQMVFEVAYLGQEPDDIAWSRSLPLEQTERMLETALSHAREWRLRQEHRPKEPTYDGPDPLPYERVVRSGLPRLEPTA